MSDWFFRQGGRGKLINWLGIDSKIDSTMSAGWLRAKEIWSAWSSTFARFRLTGWRRVANELVSECFTIGAGGLLVLYALALPALLEFDEGKFLTGRFSVKFLDQSGNEIGKRGILHNDAIPLEDLPPHLIKAVLATEDRRFFEHFGVDFIGTARALVTNVQANQVVQGGSTLTQQLAKNLFLSSERSFSRKLKEVFLAFLLEARFTKRQILKLYLDRAYMGGGAFGVEAASQFYFGKSVREVTLAEAAMLAGLFKAPTKYAPHANMPAARARTNDVLSNLVDAGYYSPAQVQIARLHPAKVVENRAPNSPDWYLDWAFEEIQRLADGKNQYVLTARTTLDTTIQRAADEVMTTTLQTMGKEKHFNSAALIAMETDGAVKAIVGGPDYGENQFNRATHAKRQPGSSFKPYVYATALENGFTSHSTMVDSPHSCGNWAPKNYSGGASGGSVVLGGGAGPVAEYGRGQPVARRPGYAQEDRRNDAAARHQGDHDVVLDGARRPRHHTDGAYRGHCDLCQRRQARQTVCYPGNLHLQGRPALLARARRGSRAASYLAQSGRANEPDDGNGGDAGHRQGCRPGFYQRRG